MSFSLINKFVFLIIFLFFLCSCSTKTVYEKIKIKKYEAPIIDIFDENKIKVNTTIGKQLNFENKITLKEFKNNNQYLNNIIVENNQIFVYENNKLINFNYDTGDLISHKELKITTTEEDILVSFNYIDNSFLFAFKSGSIIRSNMNGEIIWHYESNKILNTQLTIFNEQIIALYGDEIKSLLFKDGTEIWSEIYQDLPVYQAQGGQLANFLKIIYFILPNSKVGSIDLNLGTLHNSKFDELPLISSINNTKDKIHIFDHYITYLDEGKYLYTLDILNDEFILFKKNINPASSNILFNNSIILKEGNFLQAINLNNGKTFWLIDSDKISKSSSLVAVRNYNTDIEIFLNNGDVLTINNKEIIEINNLSVGKVKNISFVNQKIIVHSKSGKAVIF